jgi:hypothetical protein
MSCSADCYLEWNGGLDSTLQTEPKRQICITPNHKNMRKYPWKHLLAGATNIGSTDYSALTMRYSRNSLC